MKLFLQSLLQVPLLQSQHAPYDRPTSDVDAPVTGKCSLSANPQHQVPLASPAYRGTLKPVLNDDTEAFVKNVLSDWESPAGAGVALVRKDEHGEWFVETKGYGIANGRGDEVDEDTLFGIGSNSKLFNAIAAGLLIHNSTLRSTQTFGVDIDGHPKPLAWDTRLKDVIPGFGLVDSTAAERVTILDALSHRTGVPRHDASVVGEFTTLETIEKVKHLKPSRPFRDLWQYNNLMYEVVSYLPTSILPSAPPFARYVKEHIFEPLGLTSTTYSYEVANKNGKLADGFGRDMQVKDTKNGREWTKRVIPYWNPHGGEDGNGNAGDGGVISSAKDMATWLQTLLLLGKNPTTGSSVIPSEVVEKVAKGVMVLRPKSQWPEMSPTVYGMGQERGSYRGFEWIEHTGGVPGFRSVIIRFPQENLGVSVLVNDESRGGYILRAIQYYIIDKALGLEPVDWHQRYRDQQKEKDEDAKDRDSPFGIPATTLNRLTAPKRKMATTTTNDVWALEGTYNNPGYGSKELCVIHPPLAPGVPPGAPGPCKEVRETINQVLPGLKEKAERDNVPTLVAEWGNPFLGYVVFRDLGIAGGRLNITGVTPFPTGDEKGSYWLAADEEIFDKDATSEVIYSAAVDGSTAGVLGFGLNGVWGGGLNVKTPEDDYEVWFEKVY